MNIAGVGDFTGNGKDDILWENPNNGILGMWAINGSTPTWSVIGELQHLYNIVGVGDFTGNGTDDILSEYPNGNVQFLQMSNGQLKTFGADGIDPAYQVADIADYYGSGTDDILWRNASGRCWHLGNEQRSGDLA